MQSSDYVTIAGFAVGILNLFLNLRLQNQALQLKRFAERLQLKHLAEYHGVRGVLFEEEGGAA